MKIAAWVVVPALVCLCIYGYPATANQIEPRFDRKVRNDLFELHMFPGWFKPRADLPEYKGSSRLVVKLTTGGSAILNPKGEELGWSSDTIELKGLDLETAKRIWGEPRGLTFDLLSDSHAEMDVYHVDMKFDKGILSSYRVRGIGISKPEWTNVE